MDMKGYLWSLRRHLTGAVLAPKAFHLAPELMMKRELIERIELTNQDISKLLEGDIESYLTEKEALKEREANMTE